MNLQLNHLNAKAAAITPLVVEALNHLVERGHIDPAQFASLRVQLDWVQYKQNFREVVGVTRTAGTRNSSPAIDMRIDTRQVQPENLAAQMQQAIDASDPAWPGTDRIPLEEFKSFRNSIA